MDLILLDAQFVEPEEYAIQGHNAGVRDFDYYALMHGSQKYGILGVYPDTEAISDNAYLYANYADIEGTYALQLEGFGFYGRNPQTNGMAEHLAGSSPFQFGRFLGRYRCLAECYAAWADIKPEEEDNDNE